MKILIIRFSSIGDIVLTSPVIRCLHQQLGAEIHFVTKEKYKNVIEYNPYLEKLWYIKNDINEVADDLKKEKFNYIVDLHKNIRSLSLRRKLKVKTFDFDKLNWEKWLMVNFKIDKLPNIHIVDRYLDAVSELGIKNDHRGLDFFIPDFAMQSTQKILIENNFNEEEFVALVIGATYHTKKPSHALLKSIISQSERPIIIIGGPEEAKQGAILSLESESENTVFNTCGKLSIVESAAIIERALWVITPDTGMMHIAAALRKRTISLWGNTIPSFGMTPYLPGELENHSIIIEQKELSCRPCSKLGKNKCPKKHFKCMGEIKAENILKHINSHQIE